MLGLHVQVLSEAIGQRQFENTVRLIVIDVLRGGGPDNGLGMRGQQVLSCYANRQLLVEKHIFQSDIHAVCRGTLPRYVFLFRFVLSPYIG